MNSKAEKIAPSVSKSPQAEEFLNYVSVNRLSQDPKVLALAALASGAKHITFVGSKEECTQAKAVALDYGAESVNVVDDNPVSLSVVLR